MPKIDIFEAGVYLMTVKEDPRNTEQNKCPRCHFVLISMPKSRADVHAELLNATSFDAVV